MAFLRERVLPLGMETPNSDLDHLGIPMLRIAEVRARPDMACPVRDGFSGPEKPFGFVGPGLDRGQTPEATNEMIKPVFLKNGSPTDDRFRHWDDRGCNMEERSPVMLEHRLAGSRGRGRCLFQPRRIERSRLHPNQAAAVGRDC